jgi:hypothetical protein
MSGAIRTKWPPGNEAAPPGKGEAEGEGNKTSCKRNYNKYLPENQGPRHIGEIANGILLEAAEVRFEKLAKHLLHCRGPALIDIKRELFTLATLIDELRGDRRAA